MPQMMRRAISLIEGVLYLVIALAVIIGGIVFFQQAQKNAQVAETSRVLNSITAQLQSPTFVDGGGITMSDLSDYIVKADLVPATWISDAGNVVTPWGAMVRFIPGMVIDGKTHYQISFETVPAEICMSITDIDTKSGSGTGGSNIGFITKYTEFEGPYLVYASSMTERFQIELDIETATQEEWDAFINKERVAGCSEDGIMQMYIQAG